jgi:hypothetical protein
VLSAQSATPWVESAVLKVNLDINRGLLIRLIHFPAGSIASLQTSGFGQGVQVAETVRRHSWNLYRLMNARTFSPIWSMESRRSG